MNEKLDGGSFNCRIVKFSNVLADPDGFGLTELEKSQLPQLEDVVWKEILSPISGRERLIAEHVTPPAERQI